MTQLRMVLASNIKKYRFLRGFSQMKLAEKAETAPNYIALIERGRKFPSDRLLEKVAEALGVNAVDLFSCQADGKVTLHIELVKNLHQEIFQEILNDITSLKVKRIKKLEEIADPFTL